MAQPLRAFAAAAHVIVVLVITNITIIIVQWTAVTTGSQYHYRPPYKQHHGIQGYPSGSSFWHIFECFDRIGVGKSLNETDVNRTVTVKTSRECEMECDKDKCHTYAFGIGSAGNGTCEISIGLPTELPVENIEYDLYTRNSKCKNKTTSCFRRLAPGRRLMDRYVRKTLKCESLRQCEEDCAQEWSFYCEGFSFRFDPRGSICQLTSVPSDKLMILKDFNADREWDFFERDKNAPKNCYRPLSGLRPWTQYGNSGPGTVWNRYDKPPPPPPYNHHQHPAPAPAPPPAQPPAHRPPQNWGFSSGDYGAKPDYSFGGGNTYYGFKDTFATGEGFPNSLQPVPPPPVQTPQHSSNECFIRRKVGFRLDRNVVVLSLTTPSLYHCELECANEKKFLCNIFSYRYSQSNSIPGDNCHLGERAFHTLDFYTDLLPDRDYDLYVRNEKGPPVCIPRRSSDSDCFERVRSGLRLHHSMTKTNMMAHSISDCEQACVNSKRFTCRAFSYRYGPPTIGQDRENCQLTDHPIPDLNPTKHFVDDPNCELYHRGSYGHGCELDKWNYYQPPPSFNRPTGPDPSYYIPPPKHGYIPPNYGGGNGNRPSYPQKPSGYLPPQYHPPSSTNDPSSIGTPSGGGYGFSEYPMYNPPPTNSIQPTYGLPSNPPPPPSPSYIPSTGPPQGGNGGSQMYLPPSSYGGSSYGGPSYNTGSGYSQGGGYAHGSVYGHGSNFNHGDWNSGYGHTSGTGQIGTGHGGTGHGGTSHGGTGNGGASHGHGTGFGLSPKDKICYLGYGSPARLMPSAVRSSLLVSNEFECKAQCSQARETSHFRCASLSFRGNNCELSDIEQRDLRPGVDFNHEAGYWLFSWDFTDAQCYTPPKGNIPPPSGPNSFASGGMEGTWQRFTVSGQPCKAGTVCTQNRDVGIWSCPIEGLNGDWDYCCRSGHYCGYSEGFNYPWCYVGSATKDQWRPCSEHYFPYPHSNRPQHWPVAYLHREGPPNMTTDYQPSIVDNFLETLRQESQKVSGSNNSSIPDFQVVDVTSNPRKDTKTDESAITKLWMWGNSKFNTTESVETTENLVTTEITTTTVNEETSTISV